MNENEALAKGLVKDKRGFSLVWIAPIIALLITSGMIWNTYIDAGTRITIVVDSGDGIKDGKTPIMYKGIKIGVVEDIHIKTDDVSKLELTALIDKEASSSVTREGNMFWIVKPKISLTEVSGLDTIVGGIYIAVMPAKNTKKELLSLPFQDHFVVLESAPNDIFDPGLSIIVNTINKGDISIGAPVLYNKQTIGIVENKKLSQDRSSIDLYLRIYTKYVDLVHEKSIFYKVDAIDVKANLSSVRVNVGSLASLIAGGVAIYNSDESFSSAAAKDKSVFALCDNFDEIMLSDNEVVLIMQDNHQLSENITKIFYRGVEAGLVKKIDYDPKKHQTKIRVKLHKDFRDFANKKAYFWIVKPQVGFSGIEGLDTIVRGNYINFISSDLHAQKKSNFTLHDKKPLRQGVLLKVITGDIQSLTEGAGLFYHNIEIGSVSSYRLNKDNKTFTIRLTVEPKYAKLINSSSMFYHNSGVEFKAGFDGVGLKADSLESVLRGGIAVETPDFKADKKLKKSYALYDSYADLRMAEQLSKNGIRLTLTAQTLGSLKQGSPVYFKQIKVGEVLSYKLDSKTKKVLLELFIMQEYANEVHDNSLFYNASGVDAKIGLSGLEINTESVETIMTGGIAFYTPSSQKAKQARNHEQFKLYATKAKAMNKYTDITLHSKDSFGLITGNLVMYKSVVVGHVEKVRLVQEGVELDLKINSEYAYLMKKDTLFWTKAFEMSLQGIENFSAALQGTFIVLQPGISHEDEKYFKLMSKAPSPHRNEDGLRLVVQAKRLGGIKENTPVYYRQINIGSVSQFRLNENATSVDIEIFIEPCYAHLIRKNSYFYNAGGIGMKVNLFGAKIKTETLESILTGGIGVLTPDDYAEEAMDFEVFKLEESFEEDALEWAPKLHSGNKTCT